MKRCIVLVISVAFVLTLILTGCALPPVAETPSADPASYPATNAEDVVGVYSVTVETENGAPVHLSLSAVDDPDGGRVEDYEAGLTRTELPADVVVEDAASEISEEETDASTTGDGLTVGDIVGLWEHGCVTYELNADGTYKMWNGLPQPGGFPKEAGQFELDGMLINSITTDEGLLCRNQTSSYEVISWSEDEFELALVEDSCAAREGGIIGHYYRVAPLDEVAEPPPTAHDGATSIVEELDVPFATETMSDGEIRAWTLDRYRPTVRDDELMVVHFYGAGSVKRSEADLAIPLAEQGADVLVVDYPDMQLDTALENDGDGFRRMLQVGACAVRFAHADSNSTEDAPPLILSGFSLGGGLAAQLALSSEDLTQNWDFFTGRAEADSSVITCEVDVLETRVGGFVGMAGAYDAFIGYDGKWGRDRLESNDSELLEFLFGALGSNPELAIRLFHGDADSMIPFINSQVFADVLGEAGYDVELIEFPGDHFVPSDIFVSAIFELAKAAEAYGAISSLDQTFQIAVLPDTQRYTSAPQMQELFTQQTKWIVDNLASEDIRFVTHLGDIVDKKRTATVPWEEQWSVADAAISLLDGHVPYSVAYGNHEFDQFNDSRAGSEMAQQWFGDSRYREYSWYGGVSPDGENFYQNFSAAGHDFLHLNLKYDPDEAAFEWAKDVLATNSARAVILSTHAYLTDEGPGGSRAPEGENIWNQLVKSHDQIFMVLGGHYSKDFSRLTDVKNGVFGEYYQVSINDAGREVYEMLADYQDYPNGGDGWMRLIEFDLDNRSINVRTYSPARDDFLTDDGSQFSFTVDLASRLRQ